MYEKQTLLSLTARINKAQKAAADVSHSFYVQAVNN